MEIRAHVRDMLINNLAECARHRAPRRLKGPLQLGLMSTALQFFLLTSFLSFRDYISVRKRKRKRRQERGPAYVVRKNCVPYRKALSRWAHLAEQSGFEFWASIVIELLASGVSRNLPRMFWTTFRYGGYSTSHRAMITTLTKISNITSKPGRQIIRWYYYYK